MGKFCTRCGKPLAEGEVCSCQPAAPVTPQITPDMIPQTVAVEPQAAPVEPQAAPVEPQVAPVEPQPVPVAPQGQPYMQAGPQGQVPPQGQPYMQAGPQGQIPPQGQPYMQAGPQGQVPPQGQPYMQAGPQGQPYAQAPKQPSQVEKCFKGMIDVFLQVIKAPVTAGKKFALEGDFLSACGLIIIQALIAGIFAFLYQARTGMIYEFVRIFPVLGATLGTIVFSVAFSALLAAVLFGANALAKNEISFKNAVCLVATRSIVLAPAMLVSLLVMLIAPSIGLILFFLIEIWALVVIVKATPVVNPAAEDLLTHFTAAALFVFVVVTYLLMTKIGVRMFTGGVVGSILNYLY